MEVAEKVGRLPLRGTACSPSVEPPRGVSPASPLRPTGAVRARQSSLFWFQKALVNRCQRPKLSDDQLARAALLEGAGQ